MAAIKAIQVGQTTYDLKATYDRLGNVIDETFAKIENIPTKTSLLTNDSNYLTEHQDISGLATKEELNDKVDKELGKLLSTENYSTAEKEKLAGIAENANNYAHPTTSGNKHIPTGGSNGLLLSYSEDGTAQWSDSTSKLDSMFTELNTLCGELDAKLQKLNLLIATNNIDLYSYGVEWDVTVSSPILTRIGNPLLHKSLPILSAYRGCVSNGTTINYYLYPEDWNYKEDGVTPSVLDGTDGVVRVHTPKFYGKSGSNGNKRWVRISLVQIDDSWVEIPEMLIDAYRCTIDLSTNKAVSVVNTSTNYRGGNNNSTYDTYLSEDPCRSSLGKPRTSVSRATMRTYANNAGSLLLCYEYYKWIFYWNYVIEYANFNCLDTYNKDLTSDGYRLGGLGLGVTNMVNWGLYNSNNPLTPCGFGNDIGNFTGIKDLIIPSFSYVIYSIRFNNWSTNTSIVTASNSTNESKLITLVKGTDNYAFYANTNYVWNSTTYNISGLTNGQKVIFKEATTIPDYTTAKTILEVDTDGEFIVTWSNINLGSTRYVGFAIEQESCNIRIYNINVTQSTTQLRALTLKMPRWRGFDNPFGDIWTNLDGVVILRTAANEPSNVYTSTTEFTDEIGTKTVAGVEIASDGYTTAYDLRETGEIIPSKVGESQSTYMCDYHWCSVGSLAFRTLLVGGAANNGGWAGVGCFSSSDAVSGVTASVGFRTLNVI